MTELGVKNLKNSEALFESIYRDSPIGIEIYDSNGKLIDLNNSCMQLFGLSNKDDVIGFDLLKDPNIPSEQISKLKNGESVNYESSFDFDLVKTNKLYETSKTGKLYLDVLITPLFLGDDKSISSYLVQIQDISDRKINEMKLIDFNKDIESQIQERTLQLRKSIQAREKLLESEKRYKDLIESIPVGISVTTPEGDLLEANSQAFKIFGYNSREDFLEVSLRDLYFNTREREKFIELHEKGLVKDFEVKFKRKDGSFFWGSLTSTTQDLGGKTAYFNIFQDITERKMKDQKLKEGEERLRRIFDTVEEGIILIEPDGQIVQANPAAEAILGLKRSDIKNRNYIGSNWEILRKDGSIMPPEEMPGPRAMKEKRIFKNIEMGVRKPDNTISWITVSAAPITDERGKFYGVVGTFLDFTHRKNAEQRLRESEESFRSTFENAAIGIAHNGLDGKFLRVNQGLCDIVKYSREELYNLTFHEITHPDDLGTDLEYVSQLLENKIQSFMMEKRYICKDNKPVWVNLTGSLVREQSGKPKYFIAVIEDITKRKEKEEELRLHSEIMTNVSEGVHLVRLDDGTIVYTNPALEEMFGYNPGEMIGKDIAIANAPTDKTPKEIKKNIMGILSETGEWHGEIKNIKKDGTLFWCYANVSIFDHPEYGKVLVSVHTDINERKKAEEKLKESEEKFRTLAEQSSVGLIIQQDDLLKFVNRAVSNIIEYPLHEIKEWKVEESFKMIHPDDLMYVKERIAEREEGNYEKIHKYECRIITKLGKLKWVEIMTRGLKYLGKHAIAVTMIDITSQKEGEEELKEISKLKSELLSRTSHELKTPLVSIKGYVDLLLQVHYENLDFYTISMLHEIRQGCSRLESLIKDLLETSQLETGAIMLHKERENLSFLIKFCLKELQGLANIRHHKIFLNIEENMITMFEKERIYEVIVNLVSNAIKYTPPKGVIKIGSEVKNNSYIISIKDNGIGLSEKDKQKIFKKFGKIERYGKGLDVVSEGSGLGLYISKGMIELHEGDIWVESKGNEKGSTFYFSLPIIND